MSLPDRQTPENSAIAAGRAAYEAFCERMRPWAPGPMKTFPPWDKQPQTFQSAWISAAAAARAVPI